MSSFTPYEIDFSVKNAAKNLGFSKKRVTFKFGFANPSAIAQGKTGPECRGSEHEVLFVWSLASGKRQLFLDGKDVHMSQSGQNGWTTDRAWQHPFPIRVGNHTYKALFISQPKNPDVPDSRPFDLRINGVSFFQFNKLYQLGTERMLTRHASSDSDYAMSPEERRQLAMAKVESLRDMNKQYQSNPPMKHEEESLISFDDPIPPPHQHYPPPPSTATPQPQQAQYVSSLTLDTTWADSSQQSLAQYTGPPPPNPYAYGAHSPHNPYAAAGASYASTATGGGNVSYGTATYAAAAPATANPYGANPYASSAPSYASAPPSQYAPAPYGVAAPAPYANYQLNPPPPQGTNTNQPSFASPSNQSYQSYGSAPSFAQPPRYG